jgi:Cu-processing system permease protein
MRKLVQFVLMDILRNKIVVLYTLLLALLSWSVLSIEDTSNKGILTLLNIILLVVPLVSILFSTIYLYNSTEFIELMVSQPVKRAQIWLSLYLGLALSLAFAFLLSAGIPLLLIADWQQSLILLISGLLITLVFVSLAFLASILSRDKAKGIGVAIMMWLYFAIMFDGLILFLSFQLSDYPIEKPMAIFCATNPIDLARIFNLIQLETSAMLGYTGAIFKDYFGTTWGYIASLLILFAWILIPLFWSLKKFKTKDL